MLGLKEPKSSDRALILGLDAVGALGAAAGGLMMTVGGALSPAPMLGLFGIPLWFLGGLLVLVASVAPGDYRLPWWLHVVGGGVALTAVVSLGALHATSIFELAGDLLDWQRGNGPKPPVLELGTFLLAGGIGAALALSGAIRRHPTTYWVQLPTALLGPAIFITISNAFFYWLVSLGLPLTA